MTFSERTIAALATAAAVALVTPPLHAQRAAADVETARELYNKGRDLKEHGNLPGALEKFKAAHALGRTPITGLELARTYAALGQPVEAREVCLGIARTPVTAEETGRSAQARKDAAKLAEEVKSKIASLRLSIKGVPSGAEATVLVDGVTVPSEALTESRQANPGTQTIVAHVAGGPETTVSAEVRAGETRDVEITVVPAPEPPKPEPPAVAKLEPAPPSTERHISPLVIPGFVVAGVGAIAGTVTGILALSAKSDLGSKCVGTRCGPEGYDTLANGRTMGTVSTIAFIVGGLGAGVGIYGLLHPVTVPARTGALSPYVGVGSAGVHGSF